MDVALSLVRILLASVFGVAGLAKLIDRQGSRRALVEFGAPDPLAAPLAVLLPIVELTTAGGLLFRATAPLASLATFVLLAIFAVVIGVNLALGRKPECHCFGQLSASPANWSTLLRNVALLGAAGFAAWVGRTSQPPGALQWLASLTAPDRWPTLVLLLLLAVVLLGAWFAAILLRQYGRLLLRVEALERQLASGSAVPPQGLLVGTPAPDFGLDDLTGRRLTLADLRAAARPVLLVFSDPNCGPCRHLLPEIAHWQRDHADRLTTALVSRLDRKANLPAADEHHIERVLLQLDSEVAKQYQANGTPSAVLVSPEGAISSRLAVGADAIRQLVTKTVEEPATPTSERPENAAVSGRLASVAQG
jgi:peroxiredoxin